MGDELLDTVEEAVKAAQEQFNSTLEQIYSSDFYKLISSWADPLLQIAQAKINEVFAFYQSFLDNPGDIAAWTRLAGTWYSDVIQPMQEQSARLSTHAMDVDDHWKGVAADAYATSLDQQVQQFDTFVDTSLKCIWSGIIGSFTGWTVVLLGLVTSLGLFIGKLVDVILLAVSGVAIGAAVVGLVSAIFALAADIGTANIQMNNVDNLASNMINKAALFLSIPWPALSVRT